MRKISIIMAILAVILFTEPAMALDRAKSIDFVNIVLFSDNNTTTKASYLKPGQTVWSQKIPIGNISGALSLQYDVTGTGSLSIGYWMSTDGVTYITPTYYDNPFLTGVVRESNKVSGKDIYPFDIPLGKYIQLFITETIGTGGYSVTPTFKLCLQ